MKSSVAAGGGHHITCSKGMSNCIAKAARLCGDEGYTIRDGASRPKLLGGEAGTHAKMSEEAELTIVCGIEEAEASEEGEYKLPPRSDESVPEPVVAPVVAPAAVCTPGATQRCVGPGACDGGQVCLASGAGFGACDCGGSVAAPAPVAPKAAEGPSSLQPPAKQEPATPAVPGAAPNPVPLAK